ncbi:MAG: hypothetical protein EOP43_05470 [Sphingobacteriaceae bacterium]|nr:MAG: hypothetical protein EOP43_05470 [Sphingobacteriaceae bacterium]
MKRLLFALLLICLFCTCKKDPYANLCGGSDPIKNLPWLKAKIETLEQFPNSMSIITRFTYKKNTYFLQGSYCTNCNYLPAYYDCDGNDINYTSELYKDLQNEQSAKEIIWKN